ncbi:hypothetical protein BJV78DRAFT_1278571 [Lactifluus subvellereus]|nr:hypothetical protein BJV78DRAFT_1278571 [Lactifluus subvellereus]
MQTPAGTDNDSDGLAIGRKDPFSRNIVEKRRLSEQLEKVVLRIQALSGLENFWRPVPFHHLQTTAMGGPVVIINLSSYHSDILIVRLSDPVVHIPTPTNFFDWVTKLADSLSATWATLSAYWSYSVKEGGQHRGWTQPDPGLFWNANFPQLLGDRLPHQLIQVLPDVLQCASIFDSSRVLPFSGVSEPDRSLRGVDSETRGIVSLNGSGSVTSIAGKAATPENVIACLPTGALCMLRRAAIEAGWPFGSSFKFLLQHNTHLSLLRVAKPHLPKAELAFLTAFHTTELTERFSGFKRVIGAMWAMADEDGQDLSEHFYRKIFSAGAQVASYGSEESAKALRYESQKLRAEKGVSLLSAMELDQRGRIWDSDVSRFALTMAG